MSSMAQILGHYPGFPEGRQHWFDRVYWDADDGTGERPLASHWNNHSPAWHQWAINALSILSHWSLRPFFELAVSDADIVPRQLAVPGVPLPMIGQKPVAAER